MVVEYGVVLASLMGAAAALTGGVLAQRYQYLLEKQKEHFVVLREQVLEPWTRAVVGRRANLEGRDPYVVLDFMAKDYRVTPGSAASSGDQAVWSESSPLAVASRRHWPRLWAEWEQLNRDLAALGAKIVGLLRKVEADFPRLPAGRAWANYPDDPAMAAKVAVVNAWATHAQLFERRNYPDWVVAQLTQFGFWRGAEDEAERRAFAQQVAAVLARHADGSGIEADTERLGARFQAFADHVEDAIHREGLPGHCDYCPKFLR